MDDLSKSFSYMFEDRKWVGKFCIGAFFNFCWIILIGIPFTLGYMLELTKNAAEGKEPALPEWNNLGEKFGKGLIYGVILIIYAIPGAIVSVIPCVGICAGPLYFLAFLFILPYITVKFALTGNFNDAFQFNQVFEFLKANLSNLTVIVLVFISLEILAWFGILILIIGIFFTFFWADLAIYHSFGQMYRAAKSVETTPGQIQAG